MHSKFTTPLLRSQPQCSLLVHQSSNNGYHSLKVMDWKNWPWRPKGKVNDTALHRKRQSCLKSLALFSRDKTQYISQYCMQLSLGFHFPGAHVWILHAHRFCWVSNYTSLNWFESKMMVCAVAQPISPWNICHLISQWMNFIQVAVTAAIERSVASPSSVSLTRWRVDLLLSESK